MLIDQSLQFEESPKLACQYLNHNMKHEQRVLLSD